MHPGGPQYQGQGQWQGSYGGPPPSPPQQWGPPAGYPPPQPPQPPQQPGMPPGPGPGHYPNQVPGPGPGPGPAGGPVAIDVGGTAARQLVIGAVVSGVVGLIAIVAGLGGDVDGGGEAAAIVIGGLFLVPPLLVVTMSKQLFRPRKLVFEPRGVRWDDPQGKPWAIAWSELVAVSISKHSAMKTPQTLNDKLVGAATDKMIGERAHVRLDLYPAHPSFPHQHPQMAHLWERQGVKNGYRLPLGSNVKYIPIIDQAMRTFAPQVYRGVQVTEGVMGLS